MDDTFVSVIIVVCTLALVAAILLLSKRAKAKNEKALKDACSAKGWAMVDDRAALQSRRTISSDSWEMVIDSVSKSSVSDQTGASGWSHKTLWRSKKKDRPVFVLGTATSSLAFEDMPAFMRSAVEMQLKSKFGVGLDTLAQDILASDLRKAFYLFTTDKSAVREIMRQIEAQLYNLPKSISPILIRSGMDGVSIEIEGKALKNDKDIQAVVDLGEICTS